MIVTRSTTLNIKLRNVNNREISRIQTFVKEEKIRNRNLKDNKITGNNATRMTPQRESL